MGARRGRPFVLPFEASECERARDGHRAVVTARVEYCETGQYPRACPCGRSLYASKSWFEFKHEDFSGSDCAGDRGRTGAGRQRQAQAGEVAPASGYKVLEPIRHGNLTVFPVVAAKSYPTGEFLTLDEGLRSGEVVVTEAGNVQGLIRRHQMPAGAARWGAGESAGAGEQLEAAAAVAGGRDCQRWQAGSRDRERSHRSAGERSGRLERVLRGAGAMGRDQRALWSVGGDVRRERWWSDHGAKAPAPMAMMAQPSVRAKAMGDKDQNEVWAEVRKQQAAMAKPSQWPVRLRRWRTNFRARRPTPR